MGQNTAQPGIAKSKFYYGYIMVIGGFFVMLAYSASRSVFGLFFDPMNNDLHWSSALLSGAFSLSVVLDGTVGILMGRLTDKWGPSRVLLVSGILAGLGMVYTTRQAGFHSKALALFWTMLTLAMVSTFLGDMIWTALVLFTKKPPTPSFVDLFYIFFYIFTWLSLYFYPISSQQGGGYKYIWLDNIIVFLGSGLFFWELFIGPIFIKANWGDFSQMTISMIYPSLDLLLLFSLLAFFRNRQNQSKRLPLLIMGVGLLIELFADSLYTYQNLIGSYIEGGTSDLAYALGYMILILAGIAQVNAIHHPASPEDKNGPPTTPRQSWPVYLPYFWLVVACFVLFINGASPVQAPGNYITIGAVIVMVVLRQVLTLRDNESLFFKAQNDLSERILAEEALRQAQFDLERRVDERTFALAEANGQMLLLNDHLTLVNQSLRDEVAERLQVQAELDKIRARQDHMLSNSPVVIYTCDVGGDFPSTYISNNVQAHLGYSVEEFLENGRFWLEHIHPDDLGQTLACFDHLIEKKALSIEYRFLCHSGEWRWIQDDVKIVLREDGTPLEALGSMIDITTRKRLESEIQASLHEKEVLLKEIHHRVKNNLQVISSLLNLQSAQINDQNIVQQFRDSQNRVRTMALIHEKLYQSMDLARIDFKDYIQSLSSFLVRSYVSESRGISFRIEAEPLNLGIDQAIPCGLIINELISNSLKHAFPENQNGEVLIRFWMDKNQFHLDVGDNGIGFPESIDFFHTKSLGLQLVNSLVKQLGGTLALVRTGGSEFQIVFSESDKEDKEKEDILSLPQALRRNKGSSQ